MGCPPGGLLSVRARRPRAVSVENELACGQAPAFSGYLSMGPIMASEPGNLEVDQLLSRARAGDESALAMLFNHHRERLRKMIRLRMDRRLSGRVDSSDVLQDAYFNVRKRLE